MIKTLWYYSQKGNALSWKKLISGVRILNNCYGLVPNVDIVCNSIRLPNEDLWYQRMGHASYKHLSIVSKHESILGIPKLNRVNNMVCGPCQLGKQMKAKHPSTQTSTTSRPLELLHLDLMGPEFSKMCKFTRAVKTPS